jgi:hypothetical protein
MPSSIRATKVSCLCANRRNRQSERSIFGVPTAAHPRARSQCEPAHRYGARTHSVGELAYLERQGLGAAIMGAREFAFGLTDYALRSLGISESKARAIVQESRMSGEGGAFERRP